MPTTSVETASQNWGNVSKLHDPFGDRQLQKKELSIITDLGITLKLKIIILTVIQIKTKAF